MPRVELDARTRMLRRGVARRFRLAALASPLAVFALGAADLLPTKGLVGGLVSLLPLWLMILAGLVSLSFPSDSRVVANADGLTIAAGGRKRLLPRESIESGFVYANTVELRLRGGDRLQIESSAADKLLEVLGLDAAHRSVRLVITRVFRQLLFWLLGPVLVLPCSAIIGARLLPGGRLAGLSAGWALGLMAGVVALVTLYRGLRTDVTVGTDGLVVRGALGERFIAFRALRSVASHRGNIELTFLDGHVERIWAGGDNPEGQVLLTRIQEAMTVQGSTDARGLALLQRSGRSFSEWRDQLRALLESPDDYRHAALSAEDLRPIVADARKPVELRIGAALALEATGEVEHIRVAASSTASDPVRLAFAQAADGELDEETLAAAIRAEGR